MNKHTDSFYAHSVPNMPEYPQLQDNIECDVCVVGAGFSGLSSALHLAEKGFKVVV
ncbi:MAG: FAD-binding oxidoreductase, partial [Gammaproteobacteria bacterium]|nr:FAD-binding oxidoreductase [Gammaproteobacteria bacterium]